jgi:hypothetical protein
MIARGPGSSLSNMTEQSSDRETKVITNVPKGPIHSKPKAKGGKRGT